MTISWLPSSKRVAIALINTCLISVSALTHAFTNYTIVDPARDGNWWLKTAREMILHAERMKYHAMAQIQDKAHYVYRVTQKEVLASSKIRAVTTSVSETENRSSEPRYTTSPSEAVCRAISFVTDKLNFDQCEVDQLASELSDSVINELFNGKPVGSEQFFDSIKEKAESDSFIPEEGDANDANANTLTIEGGDDTNDELASDKAFLIEFARQMEQFSRLSNSLAFMTEEQHEESIRMTTMIFGDDVRGPLAEDISRRGLRDLRELDSFTKSMVLKAVVDESFTDRTIVDGKPKSALLGSITPDEIKGLGEMTKDTVMSDEVYRVWALIKARQLVASLNSLKQALNKEKLVALELKE